MLVLVFVVQNSCSKLVVVTRPQGPFLLNQGLIFAGCESISRIIVFFSDLCTFLTVSWKLHSGLQNDLWAFPQGTIQYDLSCLMLWAKWQGDLWWWTYWICSVASGQVSQYNTGYNQSLMCYIDGLGQERCNSSALAMELCFSCTKPSGCLLQQASITGIPMDLSWLLWIMSL